MLRPSPVRRFALLPLQVCVGLATVTLVVRIRRTGGREHGERAGPARVPTTPAAREPTTSPAEAGPRPAPPASGSHETLDSLLARIPPGREDEWGITRIRPGETAPEWVRDVVRAEVGPLYMDEAPFRVDLAFGKSDESWFLAFNACLRESTERAAPGAASEAVLARFGDSLREVAGRRVRGSALISGWLVDPAPLRDLDPASRQHEWLLAMLGMTISSALWEGQDLGTTEADTRLLSARDLPLLFRWKRRIFALTVDAGIDISGPRGRELARPVAEEFRDLVLGRK